MGDDHVIERLVDFLRDELMNGNVSTLTSLKGIIWYNVISEGCGPMPTGTYCQPLRSAGISLGQLSGGEEEVTPEPVHLMIGPDELAGVE